MSTISKKKIKDKNVNSTLFDKSGIFEKYHDKLEQLIKILKKFGLTEKESKIYVLIGKHGLKKPSEITKNSDIIRSEVYRYLNSLEKKGMIQISYDPIANYSIVSPEKHLEFFIKEEEKKIQDFRDGKEKILKIWNDIPNFQTSSENPKNIFQSLRGNMQVHNKLKEMIEKSKNEFLLLGSDKNFANFYFADVFDALLKTKYKLLVTNLEKSQCFFENLDLKNISEISEEQQNSQCFAISDRAEVIFFTTKIKNEKTNAIYTNSEFILKSLSLLFDMLWKRNNEKQKSENQQIDDSEFKLKELKQQMIIIDDINKMVKQKMSR